LFTKSEERSKTQLKEENTMNFDDIVIADSSDRMVMRNKLSRAEIRIAKRRRKKTRRDQALREELE
jgi:hypothetical protein